MPVEESAANMYISTYTGWVGMCMKLLHMFEKIIADTFIFGKIELDEKYVLKYADLLSCKMSRIIYNIWDKRREM